MAEKDRIPAGLIKMSNGIACVAYLDRRYLLGPVSAHMNITGISGLATKTSYAMFLIQALLQKAPEEERKKIAVILLNVKHGNLMQIDQEPDARPDVKQMELWEALDLRPGKFENVHYFVPLFPGVRMDRQTAMLSRISQPFMPMISEALRTNLICSLLMCLIPIIQIISEIREGVLNNEREFQEVSSWTNLLDGPPIYDPARKGDWHNIKSTSLGVFRRHMRRMVKTRQSGVFVESLSRGEKPLGETLAKTLEGGNVYVVDIAKLYDHEQMLVFGDLLRTVYRLKSENLPGHHGKPVPDKIIIFVDELNKYAPSGHQVLPLTQNVIDIAERGRPLGVILISCQQFMSQAHERVTGNCATKVIGRSAAAELQEKAYKFLDKELKFDIGRLVSGELIISHPVYRQPVKIIFPKPTYRGKEF